MYVDGNCFLQCGQSNRLLSNQCFRQGSHSGFLQHGVGGAASPSKQTRQGPSMGGSRGIVRGLAATAPGSWLSGCCSVVSGGTTSSTAAETDGVASAAETDGVVTGSAADGTTQKAKAIQGRWKKKKRKKNLLLVFWQHLFGSVVYAWAS